MEQLRLQGATELYDVCRGFTEAVNRRLPKPAVMLDPGEYSAANFSNGVPVLFQISLRGRLLQLEFAATEEHLSSEDFRKPYVLTGAIRSFNQDFLDHNIVDEKAIFYCPEGVEGRWHYSDRRTYGTGVLTQDFLVSALEQLL